MAKEECIICKAPLEYLQTDELIECAICHKKEYSKTRCVNGHYVCNECHTAGVDVIIGLCLEETSRGTANSRPGRSLYGQMVRECFRRQSGSATCGEIFWEIVAFLALECFRRQTVTATS